MELAEDDAAAPPCRDTAALLPTVQEEAATWPAACPHCRCAVLWRWGRSGRGLQRWRCRECRRSCSAVTGTVIAGIHEVSKLEALIRDMARPNPRSCRSLALTLNLDKSTVWRWRRDVCESLIAPSGTTSVTIADRCRTVFRESRKASREWVLHSREPERFPAPDRRQWFVYRRRDLPLPRPMARYRIVIDCAAGPEEERLRLTVLGSEELLQASPTDPLSVPDDAVTAAPADGQARRGQAGNAGRWAARSETSAEGRADRALQMLRTFLRPLRGPATRHLAGYVAWLATRLDRSESERCRIIAASLVA